MFDSNFSTPLENTMPTNIQANVYVVQVEAAQRAKKYAHQTYEIAKIYRRRPINKRQEIGTTQERKNIGHSETKSNGS
jgi:hypothetical protein